MRRSPVWLLGFVWWVACGPQEGARDSAIPVTSPAGSASSPTTEQKPITISVVGTNDLHGRVLALPLLGGYLDNLRRVRAGSGGVLLVDAGDMYQGTLESNLLEGVPVRDAYAKLGYAAVAIGNHEFDFGPLGPKVTPNAPSDDPRGALLALAAGAPYPFLAANVLDAQSHAHVSWPNVKPSALIEVGGAKIGLIGVTTEETLKTTIAPNVADLQIGDLAQAIAAEASALHGAGASAVVLMAHAGGKCQSFNNDTAHDTCEPSSEIFRVARALPPGAVDVIVAGHTHAGVAHEVNGIAIIEQFAYGRAFGRVDLVLGGEPLKVRSRAIFAPRDLCPSEGAKANFEACDPGQYEGSPVVRSQAVAQVIAGAVDNAKERRLSLVGATLEQPFKRSYDEESALGNLYADLLREAAPKADVAFMNGGGLRTDLPAGKLTYGALFESFPFDNYVAEARMSAGDLKRVLTAHLKGGGGILSLSGLELSAQCSGAELVVKLKRKQGAALKDDTMLTLVGSDFLFLGGDAFWGDVKPPEVAITTELARDVLERGLKKRAKVKVSDVFDETKRRLVLAKKRPIKCP